MALLAAVLLAAVPSWGQARRTPRPAGEPAVRPRPAADRPPVGAGRQGPEAYGEAESPENVQYQRPSAQTVRREAQSILAQPRFMHRQSFWDWLREQLGKIRWPRLDLSAGWGEFLAWALVIWAVLTLAAILAHLVWTVVLLVRGRSGRRGAGRVPLPRFGKLMNASGEELLEHVRSLVAAGRFKEAVGVLMLALLRHLEQARLLVLHDSKTNGDYLREFQAAPGREPFRRFVGAFDLAVYGRSDCSRQSFDQLDSLFRQAREHAPRQPQV